MNKTELLNSAYQSVDYCYHAQVSEVSQRIRTYIFSCYRPFRVATAAPAGGSLISIPIGIDWQTAEEEVPSGTQFTVKGQDKYMLGAIVSGPTQECTSSLKVLAGNRFWKDRFEVFDKVARGESVTCPY